MRNPVADDLLAFLNASPTPWHAVAEAARRLEAAGAARLREDEAWSLAPGRAAFVARGGTLIALRVPDAFSVRKPLPFRIAAAHTDSPGLRLKPRALPPLKGYRRWGVEVYGGALFNSWLDRDLGIAGRAFVAGASEARLLRLDDAPVRVPQLAIHLDREVNERGLVLNAEKHLVPVLGLEGGESLEARLERALGVPFTDLSFELCLYDLQPAAYGGLGNEFLHSGRLDNLAMCHAALSAFLAAPAEGAVQVAALFDHEEVGSVSGHGARSAFLGAVLERAALALGLDREAWLRLLPQSFLLSADMAHALHPNYPDRHDGEHFPVPNGGPVLKANANARYMTDATSGAAFREWARRAGVPVQDFVNRADLACGSTVGPLVASELGIPAADAGSAMLSMHSAREMCGADDPGMMTKVMGEFYRGE